jgi:broad specificity phosphatase PhoE
MGYDSDDLGGEASDRLGARVFVLARHAEAGKKKQWPGPDTQRPLSATGQQQAVGLAHNLVMIQSPRLITSPYLRCRQTLEPLAGRRGSRIETDERLVPDGRPAALDDLLSDPAFDNSVVCTHGETIAAILRRWSKLGLVRLPIEKSDIRVDSTAKGGCWIVIDEGTGWSAHYLRPVHVGPVLSDT